MGKKDAKEGAMIRVADVVTPQERKKLLKELLEALSRIQAAAPSSKPSPPNN